MLALKIIEVIIKKGITAELCMVGPDKDGSLTKCKEYAHRNKLLVTFTGKLSKDEWISLSRDYDIFINTTNFDNMPVSVIEAMALGLPVISTDVGGMPYLIEHNKTGVLVPPNDETVFVNAIYDLISNPEKASSLAKNARKYVEQFDWEIVKYKWFEVF
jgi:glycosyltransferase involved in cell wall biosynthesis